MNFPCNIRVFTLVGAVTNGVTCIVPSSFVTHDMMTRRYPTVNPKYQAFLAEKDEKEVKISSPITPKEGPTPPPMGQLLLVIKIQSLDRQTGCDNSNCIYGINIRNCPTYPSPKLTFR